MIADNKLTRLCMSDVSSSYYLEIEGPREEREIYLSLPTRQPEYVAKKKQKSKKPSGNSMKKFGIYRKSRESRPRIFQLIKQAVIRWCYFGGACVDVIIRWKKEKRSQMCRRSRLTSMGQKVFRARPRRVNCVSVRSLNAHQAPPTCGKKHDV